MGASSVYLDWKRTYISSLKNLADKQVLLLYSGGKDSSVAMDLMLRAADEYGFSFTAHGGAYPIHRYSERDKEKLYSYWKQRGVTIVWHSVADTDDLLEKAENPCKLCQQLRRQKFSTFLQEEVKDWSKLVLVACYSLNDLVSYSIEHILGGLARDGLDDQQRNFRPMETAQRFYPLLKMREGYTVFRPLVYFNESTIIRYLEEMSIPYLSTRCTFREFRPKRLLQEYYDKMGLEFDYNKLFKFMKNIPDFPLEHSFEDMERDAYISRLF